MFVAIVVVFVLVHAYVMITGVLRGSGVGVRKKLVRNDLRSQMAFLDETNDDGSGRRGVGFGVMFLLNLFCVFSSLFLGRLGVFSFFVLGVWFALFKERDAVVSLVGAGCLVLSYFRIGEVVSFSGVPWWVLVGVGIVSGEVCSRFTLSLASDIFKQKVDS